MFELIRSLNSRAEIVLIKWSLFCLFALLCFTIVAVRRIQQQEIIVINQIHAVRK